LYIIRGIRLTPIITAIIEIPTGSNTPRLSVIAVTSGASCEAVTIVVGAMEIHLLLVKKSFAKLVSK